MRASRLPPRARPRRASRLAGMLATLAVTAAACGPGAEAPVQRLFGLVDATELDERLREIAVS